MDQYGDTSRAIFLSNDVTNISHGEKKGWEVNQE